MTTRQTPDAVREARQQLSDHEQMLDAQSQCVPCKLCGGKAVISDAGTGAGYYIKCSGATNWRASTGCMIDMRRLGGWAYNVMDWWNGLHGVAALDSRADDAGEVKFCPKGFTLVTSEQDDDCGCPEEFWDTPFGPLHMHLSAGKPSNAHIDFGDEGECEVTMTFQLVDEARAAFFGWAIGLSVPATPAPAVDAGAVAAIETAEVKPLSLRLALAEVASCSCGTKTNEPRFHEGRCLYRVLRDAQVEIERLTALNDKYFWQVRDTCARAERAEAAAPKAASAPAVDAVPAGEVVQDALSEAIGALQPFADADEGDPEDEPHMAVWPTFTVGDLRRAVEAVKTGKAALSHGEGRK